MRITVLAAAAALLVTGAPVALADVGVPRIDWQACGPEHPGFECASVKVPLDYDNPRGATTSVALARKPATDKARRIGSLFLNPGGPGGSGVDFALGAGNTLSANLQGRFDIVGFDPRGIGRSDPLHCFASTEELDKFFEGMPGFPYQAAQERPYFERYRSLGPECRDDQAIARHMSTADVARDMDLLRRAVGDRKISYLGFSYGSYLGATYANLFPNNIRALVVDGVLNPELWSSGRQIESDRIATKEEFREFLRNCDEAACVLGPNSEQRWNALLASVRAKPIQLGDQLYTYDAVISTAIGAMYNPRDWPDTATLFDQLSDAATLSVAAEPDYPNGFDAYNGNVCADIEFPRAFEAYRATARYAEAGSEFGPAWWWGNAACANWPVNHDRYTGPWRTRTNAPVLVVGNHFDGVTDFRGAQAVNRQLAGSRLLAYAGWGHTAYGLSKCATDHTNAYLLNGTLPPVGTVCPANPNPFLPATAALSEPLFQPTHR
ncbi:alpha/beta hydrolase family protein [Lentzea atacamensis]|uniref:Alpha/beta hydrolase family protein n=1 Tax=Lentzea atacamensis TaxID=531938 RepID=A0A316HLT0_9PSEU|nr:alpha/beta hydrolase [Lentzea atacamensis]PWK81170.1 alpha/beta hydrolase family protein [Lentzea atacamensis]